MAKRSRLILLNKPFGVLCQFTDANDRATLADYLDVPDVYPAGRLDRDSEGLVVLTDNGRLQHRIADPRHKLGKTYCVQVDGSVTDEAIDALSLGPRLRDGPTRPCQVSRIEPPGWLWDRNPPVRYRASIPTSWIRITLHEGRNRQVRRMTAAVGFATLRLIRTGIGDWSLDGLAPGQYRDVEPTLP